MAPALSRHFPLCLHEAASRSRQTLTLQHRTENLDEGKAELVQLEGIPVLRAVSTPYEHCQPPLKVEVPDMGLFEFEFCRASFHLSRPASDSKSRCAFYCVV
jgi:hypothetical protein